MTRRRRSPKRCTIQDVAAHAGVSVATVSHVINNTDYVSPELTERVAQAIQDLGYRPDKIARAMTRREIPLVALIVPDIGNPYWSAVSRAVQDVNDQHNYSVIVCSSDGLLERELRFLRSLSGWISGLILHPYHVTPEQLCELIGTSVPVVILGDFGMREQEYPSNWDRVLSNNQELARSAVKHLLDLGHRRIGLIQGLARTPSGVRRQAGYEQALQAAGIPIDPAIVVPGDYTREGGQRGMETLLNAAQPPTAVFCANDLTAIGALETLRAHQITIPQDISVVSFDDIDEAAQTKPPLTTVSQSPRDVGRVVAETLIERLKGRVSPVRVDLPGSLTIRQSTSPPPTRKTGSTNNASRPDHQPADAGTFHKP